MVSSEVGIWDIPDLEIKKREKKSITRQLVGKWWKIASALRQG